MININCVIDAMLLHKIEHYKYCAWGLAIVIDFYIATTCIYFQWRLGIHQHSGDQFDHDENSCVKMCSFQSDWILWVKYGKRNMWTIPDCVSGWYCVVTAEISFIAGGCDWLS